MRQFVASSPLASPPPSPLPWPAGDAPPAAARWLAVDLPRVEAQLALDEALLEEAHAGRLTGPVVRSYTVVVDGRNVDLTRTEFDLVASLLSTGRRVRSKADLVLTLRGQNYVTTYFVNEADKRAVEVHMANIRRKLGDSSTTPRWIETVRGVGYRMAEDG